MPLTLPHKPRMVAVTIGVGDRSLRMAERAGESICRRTGLPVIVLRESIDGRHPSYTRLWLWDLIGDEWDAVLYFDADTYCCRPWDPTALELGPFHAVLDFASVQVDRECRAYGLDAARYFNAGVFVAARALRPVFELAQRIVASPDYRSPYWEQSALNAAVQRSGVELRLLPREYNAICRPGRVPENAVILHRAGNGRRRNSVLFERLIREVA